MALTVNGVHGRPTLWPPMLADVASAPGQDGADVLRATRGRAESIEWQA